MGVALGAKASTGKGRGSKLAGSSSGDDASRPSLERVATSSLLPSPRKRPAVKSPQNGDHQSQIWGHMLSSPSPPSSPSRAGASRLAPTLEEEEIDELEDDIGGMDPEQDRASSPGRPRRLSTSSPRSRTQSLSPTRPTQSLPNFYHPQLHTNPTLTRVREQTFSRSKSEVGPQRTNKRAMIRNHSSVSSPSTSTAASSVSPTEAMGSAAADSKLTLEWACANVPAPASPDHPTNGSTSPSTSTITISDAATLRRDSRSNSAGTMKYAHGPYEHVTMEYRYDERNFDDATTETEMDARTEYSDDTEAITPSEGRSIASIGSSTRRIALGSTSRSSGSPQSSFSSEFSAISSLGGHERTGSGSRGSRPGGGSLDMGPGPFAKRAADMLGAAGIPRSTSRLPTGQGRTVRNPFTSQGSSQDVSSPATSFHTRAVQEDRARVEESTSMIASSPDEIEAALALCGLIASGRGSGP